MFQDFISIFQVWKIAEQIIFQGFFKKLFKTLYEPC